MLTAPIIVWAGTPRSPLSSHQFTILRIRGGNDDPPKNPIEMLFHDMDANQFNDLLKAVAGVNKRGLPSKEESMKLMLEMLTSGLFENILNDPNHVEHMRQMVLNTPLMRAMYLRTPGSHEILFDPFKWRETTIAAGKRLKKMGDDYRKGMQGGGDGSNYSDFGEDAPEALHELFKWEEDQ